MNATELKYLMSYDLSHISKSLYTFYLRPLAMQNQNIIDLTGVANYLFNSSKFFPTTPNLNVAAMCLDELEQKGLLQRSEKSASWQGCTFVLPLFVNESKELPEKPFAMSLQWEPSANFHEACIVCGLEDSTFTQSDLQKFRTYWAGRHEARNQVGWERSFAQRLLKIHQSTVPKVYVTKETALGSTNYVAPQSNEFIHKGSVDDPQVQLQNLFKK